jgi:hypothetical protein
MLDSLRYLSHGKLALAVGNDPISKAQLSPEDRETVRRRLADPGAVLVAHTKDFENFQGTNDKLMKFAAAEGYRVNKPGRIAPDGRFQASRMRT